MVVSFRSADIAAERKQVLPAQIPLSTNALNVLTQVRKTLGQPDIEELALSLLAQGQHAPGVVVALTPDEAREYVAEINELWGSNHHVRELVKTMLDDVPYYLIVVAGHRRLRAAMLATTWLQTGEHVSERFTGSYLCEIHFGLSVEQALSIQFHENRHQQVAIHEEVAAAWRAWRYMKRKNDELTVTAFSKVVARSPSWVRNMLRFCDLPESVQRLIEPNGATRVSYQLLVQIARLVEVEEAHGREHTEQDLHAMVMRLIVSRTDPRAYAKTVAARIRDLEEGQGDLLFGGGDSRPLRKIAAPELIRGVHAVLGYMREIEHLRRVGAFGKESPLVLLPEERGEYSPGSPIRLMKSLADVSLELLPHLITLARREKQGRKKLEAAFSNLEAAREVFLAILANEERS